MNNAKLKRWPILLMGFIALFFAGIIYAWSILKYPFEVMWSPGQLGLNYTITIIFFCVGLFTSGLISKRTSPRLRLIIGAILLFTGFFVASFLVNGEGKSIVPLYLTYGVLCGTGIGLVYNTVISIVNVWYPDKMGLCSGILMAGFGLSSMILGRVIDVFGNLEIIGWRNTYIIIAIALGAILSLASFIIKQPPPGTVFPEKNLRKSSSGVAIQEVGNNGTNLKECTVKELLKSPSFIKLAIIIFTLSAVGSAAVGFARNIALDVGASAGFAVTVVGLVALANGLVRPVAGWLYDNIGVRKTQYIVGFMTIAAPLTVVFAFMTNSLLLGVVGLCMCGLALGMSPTTGSVFIMKLYGPERFSLMFGIVNLTLIPAPFATTLAGSIKDSTGEFTLAFILLTAISIIGTLVFLSLRLEK